MFLEYFFYHTVPIFAYQSHPLRFIVAVASVDLYDFAPLQFVKILVGMSVSYVRDIYLVFEMFKNTFSVTDIVCMGVSAQYRVLFFYILPKHTGNYLECKLYLMYL